MSPSGKAVSIYAHRGLWTGGFPENSREAFAYASSRGFRSECDVWLTADRLPVVMHDDTVERTTTSFGLVEQFTSCQLSMIRCRVGDREFSPPPLLVEVAHDVALVEVKSENPEIVPAVIEAMHGQRWMLQSFHAAIIEETLRCDSRLAASFLAADVDEVRIGVERGWSVHLDHVILDDRLAQMLRDFGKSFGVWTVNTDEDVRRVLERGATVIISNQPDLVRNVAEQMGFTCRE